MTSGCSECIWPGDIWWDIWHSLLILIPVGIVLKECSFYLWKCSAQCYSSPQDSAIYARLCCDSISEIRTIFSCHSCKVLCAIGGLIHAPQIAHGIQWFCQTPAEWNLAGGPAKLTIPGIAHSGGIKAFRNWYRNVPWNSPERNATGIRLPECYLIYNIINMFTNN